MAKTYEDRQELLAKFWTDLREELDPARVAALDGLPLPCLNHVEDRLGKPDRAVKLAAGCQRLCAFAPDLLLEGLRLYPHALCRAAETLGPLPESAWNSLKRSVSKHHLWTVSAKIASPNTKETTFWWAVGALTPHRDLPQSLLDFLEEGRPRESAPWQEFLESLNRYLVRARLEKLRFDTYAVLRGSTSCSDT